MWPLTYAGFDQIKALSRHNAHPESASRPFDAERDGFVRITPDQLQRERAGAPPESADEPDAPSAEQAAPAVELYRAQFDSGVRVAMGGRTLFSGPRARASGGLPSP